MLETLLLLALPASGKSELRRYLDTRTPDELAVLHLRPGLQLDDYPYVHVMRRISAELAALGEPPVFFASGDGGWLEPRDWGTLIRLLNEDYERLAHPLGEVADTHADRLLDRLDAARRAVGAPAPFADLEVDVRERLCAAIESDAAALTTPAAVDRDTYTVVIEFARGGPQGASLPLESPYGYAFSLAQLSEPILESAAILYVWVDPDESRRRNRERAKPGPAGDASILYHGVPEEVMTAEYGTDDMEWLLDHSEQPDTVGVAAHGRRFLIPAVRFDNRSDLTSFLRAEPAAWDSERLAAVGQALKAALDRLADLRSRLASVDSGDDSMTGRHP